MARAVDHPGGIKGERAGRLARGAHRQQHPPHVGVMDDRRRRPGGGADRSALDAAARKGARLLIGAFGDGYALQPDIEPGAVHHREHGGKPVMRRADEPADRAFAVAEGKDASRARVNAELVFEADAADIVAAAERAVRIDEELGHQEERDAVASFRRIGKPRQHQMHDVRRPVVLAIGDEDLLAVEPVMIALRHRARAQRAEIGARLRLGEIHGAGPGAADKLVEIEPLLLRRAVGEQQLDRADGENGAERERDVGARPHLGHGGGDRLRQALAAMLGRDGDGVPAALDIARISFLEARRRAHDAVLERGAGDVAAAVQAAP